MKASIKKDSNPQFPSVFTSKTMLTAENTELLNALLNKLLLDQSTQEFREPVRWQQFGLYNYLQIIAKPMDLSTIKKNISLKVYRRVEQALNDIQIIWDNSKLYNAGNEAFVKLTLKCQSLFHKSIKNYFPKIKPNKTLTHKKKQKQSDDYQESKPMKKGRKPKYQKCLEKSQTVSSKAEDESILQRIEQAFNTDEFIVQKSLAQESQVQLCVQELREKLLKACSKCTFQQCCIIYMVIKAENIKAIKTDQYGNAEIDVPALSSDSIKKILDYIQNDQVPRCMPKSKKHIKEKKIEEKSKYDI